MGVPCTISVDHSILESLTSDPSPVPPALKHQLQIAYLGFQVSSALGTSTSTSSGLSPDPFSAVKIFERDFSLLEHSCQNSWTPQQEVLFHGTKLVLYLFALSDMKVDKQWTACTEAESFVRPATSTALKLVSVAGAEESTIHWSAYSKEILITTAFFLITLLDCRPADINASSTRSAIATVWTCLRNCAIEEDDHMSRLCVIISHLSQKGLTRRSGEFALRTRSRMSANFLWDTIWLLREQLALARDDSLSRTIVLRSGGKTPCSTEPGVPRDQGPQDTPHGFPEASLLDWDALLNDYDDYLTT